MHEDYLQRVFGLRGRTALVTGSCSGIGLAIAAALGQAGARVLINGRDAHRCRCACDSLAIAGVDAGMAPFDVSDELAVAAWMRQASDEGIAIDVLVANAGTQNRKPLDQMTLPEWRALMSVHVEGAFNCARAALPGMSSRGFGRVMLMSSVAGEACMPNLSAYASAKGALAALARALAVEYGGHGITVNAIAPGFVRTPLTHALQTSAQFQQFLAAGVPAARWAQPDEIAPAAVFLASSAGAFVNGHVLTVDGGLLARM